MTQKLEVKIDECGYLRVYDPRNPLVSVLFRNGTVLQDNVKHPTQNAKDAIYCMLEIADKVENTFGLKVVRTNDGDFVISDADDPAETVMISYKPTYGSTLHTELAHLTKNISLNRISRRNKGGGK